MIESTEKLTVLHDDNGVFVNHTEDAADLTRDNFNLTLVAAEDYLYLGHYKPFGTLFAGIITGNTNSGSFAAEYYNGSTWVSLDLSDESRNFTREGYMFWNRDNMKSTSVNSVEAFYIRLRPDVDHSATVIRGINLIFADDSALKQEFFEVDNSNLLPPGEISHLVHHVAARNTIVQTLRNKNYKKHNEGSARAEEINQWDLMDIFQVRQAATMLALSKIFFTLSDSQEDTWWAKYEEYQRRYEHAFELINLSVDTDNDGEEDINENQEQFKIMRWTR